MAHWSDAARRFDGSNDVAKGATKKTEYLFDVKVFGSGRRYMQVVYHEFHYAHSCALRQGGQMLAIAQDRPLERCQMRIIAKGSRSNNLVKQVVSTEAVDSLPPLRSDIGTW
jgi:hypothetical protein